MSSENRIGQTDIYTSGEYLRNNPDWHAADGSWKAANVIAILRKNGLAPATVCEVGTGSGEVLKLLADDRPEGRYLGFDISPQAIEIAKSKARRGLDFKWGSPFEDDIRYDLALALDVFEHVPDYLGFLRNMTKISDYQVYNIPLDLSVRSAFKPRLLMDHRTRIGHLHYFNKDTALATLEDTGHQVIDWALHSPAQQAGGLKGAIRKTFFAVNPSMCVNVMGFFAITVLCRS